MKKKKAFIQTLKFGRCTDGCNATNEKARFCQSVWKENRRRSDNAARLKDAF